MIWSASPTCSERRSSRSRTGWPRCNGPARRVFRSSSSGSIRRARSPSAIRQRACNSHASAGLARCGTCIRHSRRPGNSCGNWPRRRTGCATCALRAMCPSPAGSFDAPVRRFAIGLGCEVQHAGALVYADDLDLTRRFEPIGISCRICERAECHQRSVPPLERRLRVNPDRRGTLPYEIAARQQRRRDLLLRRDRVLQPIFLSSRSTNRPCAWIVHGVVVARLGKCASDAFSADLLGVDGNLCTCAGCSTCCSIDPKRIAAYRWVRARPPPAG